MIEDKKTKEAEKQVRTFNGKPIKDVQITCSKHGNISNGAYFTSYVTYRKGENGEVEEIPHNNVFCIACLNNMYRMLQNTPITNEKGEIKYLVDKEGKEIVDENGEKIPDTLVGRVDVTLELDDNGKAAAEEKIPVEEANIQAGE